MSKLSFRSRQVDYMKPLPVFMNTELPDLQDFASINRSVPQMPTGMEKEEETEHHLQRALSALQAFGATSAANDEYAIPTPSVEIDNKMYDKIYSIEYARPKQYVRIQPFSSDYDYPDYDADYEDEAWLDTERKNKLPDDFSENLVLYFEMVMDRLEKAAGYSTNLISLDEAEYLLIKQNTDENEMNRLVNEKYTKEREQFMLSVYEYWKEKRQRLKHPLTPIVLTDKSGVQMAPNNPYLVFRRRTEKMQTRKNRKNEEQSYEKMLILKRDLSRAHEILKLIRKRENFKKELLKLTLESIEKRFKLNDYDGQIEESVKSQLKPALSSQIINAYKLIQKSSTNDEKKLNESNKQTPNGNNLKLLKHHHNHQQQQHQPGSLKHKEKIFSNSTFNSHNNSFDDSSNKNFNNNNNKRKRNKLLADLNSEHNINNKKLSDAQFKLYQQQQQQQQHKQGFNNSMMKNQSSLVNKKGALLLNDSSSSSPNMKKRRLNKESLSSSSSLNDNENENYPNNEHHKYNHHHHHHHHQHPKSSAAIYLNENINNSTGTIGNGANQLGNVSASTHSALNEISFYEEQLRLNDVKNLEQILVENRNKLSTNVENDGYWCFRRKEGCKYLAQTGSIFKNDPVELYESDSILNLYEDLETSAETSVAEANSNEQAKGGENNQHEMSTTTTTTTSAAQQTPAFSKRYRRRVEQFQLINKKFKLNKTLNERLRQFSNYYYGYAITKSNRHLGLVRRRYGRGGRIILDRVNSNLLSTSNSKMDDVHNLTTTSNRFEQVAKFRTYYPKECLELNADLVAELSNLERNENATSSRLVNEPKPLRLRHISTDNNLMDTHFDYDQASRTYVNNQTYEDYLNDLIMMRNHESSYVINSLLGDDHQHTSTLEHLSELEEKEAIDSMNKCYDHTLFESYQLSKYQAKRANGTPLASNEFINDATSDEKSNEDVVEMTSETTSDKLVNDSNNNCDLFTSNYIAFDAASTLNDQFQSETRTDCLVKANVKFAITSLKKSSLVKPAQQQPNQEQQSQPPEDVNRSKENKSTDLADEQNDNNSSSEELAHEIESIQIKKSQEESTFSSSQVEVEQDGLSSSTECSTSIAKHEDVTHIKQEEEEKKQMSVELKNQVSNNPVQAPSSFGPVQAQTNPVNRQNGLTQIGIELLQPISSPSLIKPNEILVKASTIQTTPINANPITTTTSATIKPASFYSTPNSSSEHVSNNKQQTVFNLTGTATSFQSNSSSNNVNKILLMNGPANLPSSSSTSSSSSSSPSISSTQLNGIPFKKLEQENCLTNSNSNVKTAAQQLFQALHYNQSTQNSSSSASSTTIANPIGLILTNSNTNNGHGGNPNNNINYNVLKFNTTTSSMPSSSSTSSSSLSSSSSINSNLTNSVSTTNASLIASNLVVSAASVAVTGKNDFTGTAAGGGVISTPPQQTPTTAATTTTTNVIH